MEKQDLIDMANTRMPFGKYQGRVLGQLMEMALGLKIEGLDGLVKPLKRV
ncbi:putative quorum-sensing-regulated virulence factor [Providencia stuartii]